jgi:Holliday junction DNA helicase RuvB
VKRVIELEKISSDSEYEKNLRPDSFDGYIGQEQIKKNLKVFIKASQKRDEALDHVLLFGPPGLGKTTLAYIIASSMNANIKIVSAPNIEKSGDLAAILTNLQEGDVLFIDEIHRLNSALEELLYPAMEDYKIDLIIGSGPAASTMQIDIPRFTLIGATTRAGMLSAPLRDRFGMHFRMNFYTHKELEQIVQIASKKLDKVCDENSSMEIASRSRLTPRVALRLLKRVRDFAEVNGDKNITIDICKYSLEQLGINKYGFDNMDIQLLSILLEAKKPMGLSTLSALLNEDSGTIEDVIEPYLIANGFIEKTSKGRVATDKTYKVLDSNTLNYDKS